ncbi:MAG: CBS domain-containing protein [Chloroflexota bacterium]
MMKISDFLKIRGRPVVTIGAEDTVAAAIQKLVEENIGALPVVTGDNLLLGIVSERDLLKECLGRRGAVDRLVKEVMTEHVAVGSPEDDLDYVTSVMKQKTIRHLPVVVGHDNHKLVGMISMRDIIDERLKEATAVVRYVGLLRGRPPHRLV